MSENRDRESPPAVLHLITRFQQGGAEKTTQHALEALLNAEEEYDLRLGFGVESEEDHVEELRQEGVDVHKFTFIRHYNPIAALIAIFEVAMYLHFEDIDLIHTHSTEAGVIGRIAGGIAGTPVIIHEVHGDPITPDRNSFLNWFITAAERLSARFASAIIVKSKLVYNDFIGRGIGRPDQYKLIYHGIDLSEYRTEKEGSEVEDSIIANSEATTLLFVGRLEQGKGLIDLLDSFEQLDEEVELLIAGTGERGDKVGQEIAKRGLSSRVHLLGYRDDISRLLNTSDIFVLPSYREGTPRVITEALASGTPVVATNIAGIPEQVNNGKTGLLFRPGDTIQLQEHLERLISSPQLRADYGKAAEENVDLFSKSTSAQEIKQLYRSFLYSRELSLER